MRVNAEFSLPKELTELARAIAGEGATLYAVGGLVRNTLLGLPVYDIDIASKVRPDRIMEICAQRGYHAVPKGIAFGMVEVHIGSASFEHTTFRSDSYVEGGAHRPEKIEFSDTIEEDAFRRDFTVNALYLDILSGELHDPTGGMRDLEARLIRTTSGDPFTVLRDDGVRILRMVRFAAELGFEVEPQTFETACTLVSNLNGISPERIRDELNKILLCDIKYGERNAEAVFHGLELLDRVGAIDIILPEISKGRGMVQKPTHHRYDVLYHSLHTAAEIYPTVSFRMAGLLHDVGKPVVFAENGNMHGHDKVGEGISREILQRLRYDGDTIKKVTFLVKNHMYDLNNTAKDSTLRQRFAAWGLENSYSVAEIREADVHGSGVITGEVKAAVRWRRLLKRMEDENVPFSMSMLKCSGKDIMKWLNMPQGASVGDIKQRLLMHCSRFPADNTPEKLQRIAHDMMKM